PPLLSSSSQRHHQDVHSFPTRRSSDLEVSTKTRHNIRLLANIIYETAAEMRSSGSNKERLLEQKVPATYLALEEVVSALAHERRDRKSTRLNSSHVSISYAVFCLKKKT